MFLRYYSYNVHTNSDYSKEKEEKKLTLYNKKKKQWGWYKREENETGVSSVLLGWLRITLLVCESEDKEQIAVKSS